jgi:Holliday junction resolvase RusA-like endonuclease
MTPVPNNVESKTRVRLDDWHRFVVQKAKPRKGEFQPVTRSTHLSIEMIFVFLQGNVTRPDLDNLVKPVFDAFSNLMQSVMMSLNVRVLFLT